MTSPGLESIKSDSKDPFRGAIDEIIETYGIMKQNEKNPPYWIAVMPTAYKIVYPMMSGLPAQLLRALPKHIIEDRHYLHSCFFTEDMKQDHDDIMKDLESLLKPDKDKTESTK